MNISNENMIKTIEKLDKYFSNIDINEVCSNHMAIFGNTGSGKSYGVLFLFVRLWYEIKNLS